MKAVAVLSMIIPFFCAAHPPPVDQYIKQIQRALDKQPALCLGETRWPVAIGKEGANTNWITGKMASLVDAGLATSRIEGRQKIWRLTPTGLTEFKKHGDFCYGRMRVKDIESMTQEQNGGGVIIFHYYIKSLPKWAENKSIRFAYTDLDNLVTGINSARYQVDYQRIGADTIKITGEPNQLDLFY